MTRPGGNPRCPICHGTGNAGGGGRWMRCSCTRPTHAAIKAQQRLNSIGTEPKSISDRMKEQEQDG